MNPTPMRVLSWILAAFIGAPIAVCLAAYLEAGPRPVDPAPRDLERPASVRASAPPATIDPATIDPAPTHIDPLTDTMIRRSDAASRCSHK